MTNKERYAQLTPLAEVDQEDVFYRETGCTLDVIRILHPRMDIERYL